MLRRLVRHPGARVVAMLLAVWFTALSVNLPGLHACALHDGVPGEAHATHAGQGGGHVAGHAAASHTSSHHATGHAGQPERAHQCTCLGQCSASVAAQLHASPELAFRVALLTPERSTGRADHDYVASWVDFVLPFATAPPALG